MHELFLRHFLLVFVKKNFKNQSLKGVQRVEGVHNSEKSKWNSKSKDRLFNPFVPNAPFLYPLKTSENFTVF